MKMTLGTFLNIAIATEGGDAETLVSAALAHYRETLEGAEPPLGIPSFLDAPARGATEVDLPLAPTLEYMLRKEAARQRVTVERLLSHVVFLYLAELDRAAGAPIPPLGMPSTEESR